MNLYDVLGVPHDASYLKIRLAYRKLVKKWHPDLNKDEGAADRFRQIQHAYEVLSDPARRARYDREGDDEPEPQERSVDTRALRVIDDTIENVLKGFSDSLPSGVDFPVAVIKEIVEMKGMIAGAIQTISATRREADKMRQIIKRLKRRKEGEDRALIPPLLRRAQKLDASADAIEEDMNDKLEVFNRAQAMIVEEGYTYDWERPNYEDRPTPQAYWDEELARQLKYGS